MSTVRIASLVPSLTETLVTLGLGAQLVARTGYCIHPAAALRAVSKVGGTKDVNLAKLRRLAPTHVLVNIDENRRETVDALRTFVPRVVVTHPCAPIDNLRLLDQLAAEFAALPGVSAKAASLWRRMMHELDATHPERYPTRRVLYLIWRDPWMTVARDTYISGMLARIGWATLPAIDGGERGAARYPIVAGDEPWLADVERVLLASEPYRFDASHMAEAQALCPRARVQCVDGERLSWFGVRALAGLRYLRELAGTPQ